MNEPAAADLFRAEIDLLATLEPILIASVCALVVAVMCGVWRLCTGVRP